MIYEFNWKLEDNKIIDNFTCTTLCDISNFEGNIEGIDTVYIETDTLKVTVIDKSEIVNSFNIDPVVMLDYIQIKGLNTKIQYCYRSLVTIDFNELNSILYKLIEIKTPIDRIMRLFDELFMYRMTFIYNNDKIYVLNSRESLDTILLTDEIFDKYNLLDIHVLIRIEKMIYKED